MERRTFVSRGLGTVLGLGVAGPLLACGDGGDISDPDDDDDGAATVVQVVDNAFSPQSVTIQTGDTVRWTHEGQNFHTITPDEHSEWARQEFPAGSGAFEHTFNTPGTFPYFCEPHQSIGMVGTITVQESS